ncbi:hypothetical protein EMCRGX_G022144 [Ephydatia muelleri]
MAKELQQERSQSSLNIEEVTNMLDGGRSNTDKRRQLYKMMLDDPMLRQDDIYFLSDEEAFKRAVQNDVYLIRKCHNLNVSEEEKKVLVKNLMSRFAIGVHTLMFIPAIEGQGTEEQQKKWLTPAYSYQIIGAYAQTELGHGTNLRGLETVATYDPTTQEFVLNTPTLTATKWWPGTLGHIATHAIVVARLVTLGHDHGIHPFIVQVRSLEDHTPLPGIKVGDIGPKFGSFPVDNGFLQLDNVRIPRDHMLMKYAQVAPNGVYTKPPVDRIAYGPMIQVRSGIVTHSAQCLAKAVTIAVRYSVVRRQGQETTGGPETQVLDYQTQQRRTFQSLAELHATSAGLKALSSELSSQGIEVCRLACGGHGYSLASGIPYLYANFVAAMTYEGENTVMYLQTARQRGRVTVMYLQTARYLNKIYLQKQPSASLPANVVYLGVDYPHHKHCGVRSATQFSDPHTQMESYRQRARRMVAMAASRYDKALAKGLKPTEAWNESTVDWTVAAKAHCYCAVLRTFQEALSSSELSPSTRHTLESLCATFAVFGVVSSPGDFAVEGYMSHGQIQMAREHLYTLLAEIRREAVPLVDAFDIPDGQLNSALGRFDGDVYKHLFDWALKAPRNKEKVHSVYRKYLKPFMETTKSKL